MDKKIIQFLDVEFDPENDTYKPDNPDHYIEYNYDEEVKRKFQKKIFGPIKSSTCNSTDT